MRRSICALFLILAAGCGSPTPAVITTPAPTSGDTAHAARIARIEASILPAVRVQGRAYQPETLAARMARLEVPGLSVAVIEDGRIVWARAYGVADAATGEPATTETLFQAASMSKPVAAMGALSLVQEGRLELDDDVNRWLTRWRVPGHEWETESPVTLRRLLSHTAGLTVHGFPGYAAGVPVPAVEQVLAGAPPANTAQVMVSSRPGENYRYSGGGTTVVQLLMEEVTGAPFARFMADRVLGPMGMASSTYEQPLPSSLAPRAATAHRSGARPVDGRYHTYPEMAAAGLWTTPTDLARWVLAVQRSVAGDTTGVLEPWMARAMIAARPLRHGLGLQIEGSGPTLRFGHGGANAGFRGSFVGFVDRGSGAVIMTNADAGGGVASELMLAIAAEYGWPDVAPREIVPVPISAGALGRYQGRYGTADQPLQVAVTVEGETLVMTAADGTRHEFVFVGDDRFQPVAGGSAPTFERAADGSIAALRIAGVRLPRQ
jgi:CubicO group peptidase (beta-lactamase class C family)